MINKEEFFQQLLRLLMICAGALALYLVVFFFIKQRSRRKTRFVPILLKQKFFYPGLLLVFLLSFDFAFPLLRPHLTEAIYKNVRHALTILAIICSGFVAIRVLTIIKELTYRKYKRENALTLRHRKARTQFDLIQRIFNAVVVVAVIAGSLMTFNEIRNLGTTILASAGLAGIVIGFAAQKSLGSIFAGIQIAIAQPVRIGDVVVVDNEFGLINEITLTFVVVNTLDGRRKIIPVSYFLEESFECWTRVSPEVLAKVKVRADYSINVEQLRQTFNSWLEETSLWDRHSSSFLVTDSDDKTIEIRATMSAKDSSDAFKLECMIREKLIAHLNKNHSVSLPQNRVIVEQPR